MMRIQLNVAYIFVMAVLAFAVQPAGAQSTAVTYQGLLNNGALPANGLHDFRFRLFDAPAAGTQLGETVCFESIVVVNGVFNVLLDFGDQFVTSDTRHLEIFVRQEIGQPCTDDFGYVLLSPRQRLTPTPLAIHANHANLANHATLADTAFALAAPDGAPADAVVVDNDGNVGIGISVPTTKLDVRGGPILVQNLGDQADLLWLANERSWVFRQEGTGSGTALKLQSSGGGGNKNFIIQTDGFVGINTTAPLAKLDVRGDIRLGSTGELLATAGVENLRIIRGTVSSGGGVVNGSGFTVTRPSTGRYTISIIPQFTTVPSVTAVAEFEGDGRVKIMVEDISFSFIKIITNLATDSAPAVNNGFQFIVIGTR